VLLLLVLLLAAAAAAAAGCCCSVVGKLALGRQCIQSHLPYSCQHSLIRAWAIPTHPLHGTGFFLS